MKHIFLNVEPMMKYINRKNSSVLRTPACRQAGITFDEGEQLKNLDQKIKKILEILRKRHWYIGVMESCTGGAIANAVTNIPGASDVFKESKVTYCNEAKVKAGVEEGIIRESGVYSINVAEDMARKIEGEVGVGITGNLPGVVYIVVRVNEKIFGRKIKTENRNEDKIKGRKVMKNIILENVVEMIIDNI